MAEPQLPEGMGAGPVDDLATGPAPTGLGEVTDRPARPALQRRTLLVLFASAILGRAGMTVGFPVAALLVQEILGSAAWAGASTAAITVGTAVSASALSGYMRRRGRRPGLTLGYAAASVGGVVAAVGGQTLLLVPFLVGLALVGVGQGATNLARYAAADLARPADRGKSISWVVFASTIGAVGGPALVGPAGDLAERFGLDDLVGPFVFALGFFALSGLVLWAGLRPDPLVVAGGLRPGPGRGGSGPVVETGDGGGLGSGVAALMAHPLARLAVLGLALSQAVMVMVMAMTPLHMDAHGHDLGVIGWVISVHTAGMFAFAPIAGWWADRFGRIITLTAGGAMLVASTVLTALAGEAPALLMFPGLFLLGLGWSFCIVAASALLTDSVDAEQQVAAQGTADFVTSFASGGGALASGLVFTMTGFHVLSLIGLGAAGFVTVTAFYHLRLGGMRLRV